MRRSLCAAIVPIAVFCAFACDQESTRVAGVTQAEREGYIGSGSCQSCHPDHHASWSRTFHRTMTQNASEEAVLGPFDGRAITYLGTRAEMRRDGEDFVIRTTDPSGASREDVVTKTVGSRRTQQYLAERDGETVRLPIAYHVEEERFFHMNGAFLTRDPESEPASPQDYERHVTRWNDNCVFCHNVRPNPGRDEGAFDTTVAELGIACEACHGPGQNHASANRDPLRRYRLHLSDDADETIVNAARLDPERSADICGRCHGQRLTDNVARFLQEGDPFVPGENLAEYSEPLFCDSTLGGREAFAERFYLDGTARLTAYEFQGLLQSPCANPRPNPPRATPSAAHGNDALTCTSCHGMHEGDPRGQLRDVFAEQPDAMCTSCHADTSALPGHRLHPETEIACVDCHMPRVVFGVIDVHRSHRIEVPRPVLHDRAERLDACSLCHVEHPPSWSARALLQEVTAPDTDGGRDQPLLTRLFTGDAITRAVAATALGRVQDNARTRGALLTLMARDPYPAIRRVAYRALRKRVPALAVDDFDPLGSTATRRDQIAALRDRVPHQVVSPPPSAFPADDIEIGE